MKINFMNFVKGLLVLFIGFCSLITLGQDPQAPTAVSSITLGTDLTGLNVGDIVHIPVILNTATGPNKPIASAIIYIDYNTNVLSPLGPDGITLEYGGSTYNPFFGGVGNNRLVILWESPTLGNVNLVNKEIATLDFIYIGGTTTAMHLRHSPDAGNLCSFADINGVVTISSFTDKTISGAASGTYDLHSVATGGPFDWNDQFAWTEGKTPSVASNIFITGEEMQLFMNTPNYTIIPKCNNLTINPIGQFTIASGISLAVAGNLLIESNPTGTGSLLNAGTLTVTGTTSAQRYVTANWSIGFPNSSTLWHYVSSPVNDATIATFMGSLLNKWNEPSNYWDTLTKPTTIPLVPGIGYGLAKLAPNGIVTFTGSHLNNNASYSPAVAYSGASYGWNLLGNPYPCAISWALIGKTNVNGAVYTWNAATGNYFSYASGVGTLTGGIIPAEQAFFVQANAASPSVTIPAAARLHSDILLYKNSIENLLTLKVKGSEASEDIAFIHFRPEATAGFDQEYDAYKMFGMEDAPQLYSITPSENLTINSLPDVTSRPTVAMGLKVGLSGTYTLTASDLGTFAAGSDIFLEDVLTSNVQNLNSNPVYTFSAAPGDVTHRFNIHFAPVGVSDHKTSGVKIYSNESTVYVNIPADMKGNIVVYNMLGTEITRTTIQAYSLNKINLNVPTGIYLVKVDGDSNTNAGKVFIK
ncbi:MAG: T9SS type A sorting domain-containing protein [Bacteroidetes bacterium]|nr:T9SS type A sorting domain-containing protein [Bacteroidota bacterium]